MTLQQQVKLSQILMFVLIYHELSMKHHWIHVLKILLLCEFLIPRFSRFAALRYLTVKNHVQHIKTIYQMHNVLFFRACAGHRIVFKIQNNYFKTHVILYEKGASLSRPILLHREIMLIYDILNC